MAKCPVCGTEMDNLGNCPHCAAQARLDKTYYDSKKTKDDVEKGKGMAILAYIGILFLIPLFVEKENEFVKYHVNQGFLLFLFEVICAVVGAIPLIGIIAIVGHILTLVLLVIGIINAYSGKKEPLPIIGGIDIKITK